jgi:hypothetical protein
VTTVEGSITATPLHSLAKGTSQGATALIRAIRLFEFNDRTSVMNRQLSNISSVLGADPLANSSKAIQGFHGAKVDIVGKIEPMADWANTIEEVTSDDQIEGREIVLTCWLGGRSSGPSDVAAEQSEGSPGKFDFLFNRSSTSTTQRIIPSTMETTSHAHFVRTLFAKSQSDVALYVDNTSHSTTSAFGSNGQSTIFFPFFGGPDDRAASDLVVQLSNDRTMRVIIVRVTSGEASADDSEAEGGASALPATVASAYEGTLGIGNAGGIVSFRNVVIESESNCPNQIFADTVYPNQSPASRLQSQTADEIAWTKYTTESSVHCATESIEFSRLNSPKPLKDLTTVAKSVHSQADTSGCMLLVVGRTRRMAIESHHAELAGIMKDRGDGHLSIERQLEMSPVRCLSVELQLICLFYKLGVVVFRMIVNDLFSSKPILKRNREAKPRLRIESSTITFVLIN